MKKWLDFLYPLTCFVIVLSLVLFCINMLKTENDKKKQANEIERMEKEEKFSIEYKANQTIRVKMSKTGEVIAMDINDYLRGVLPAEMPPSYDIEALKAQAIVARTYTYKKMSTGAEGEGVDMCDDYNHCQAFYTKDKLFDIWRGKGYSEDTINEYWSKVNEAVVSTQNQVITYNGEYIKAFFHASSPIKTENIDQIWGGENLPYLVSVESKENEEYANRTSRVEIEYLDFINKLKENDTSRSRLNKEVAKSTCINEYTTSGRVKNIKVGEYVISAEKLRTIFGLKSTNFTIELSDNSIIFNVIGYGHGVGMSQVGADTYAKEGMKYDEIIKHYYNGVDIITLD